MVKVAGIRFRKAGKIYYFDPGDVALSSGEHVIVETVRGVEYGVVVLAEKEVPDDQVVKPLKKVLRLATDEDKEIEIKNKELEREAFRTCKKKVIKHELDMKLIDCEYTFDNNKLLFYFTADGRVDFRELVKDLASVFKTRIELRQIGVRDETKMMGSIGICGRTLCCHAHLSDFHPVSIRMAKEQNLSLNPTKISGVCGRLMCCLKYEEETYKELNRNLPRIGNKVKVKSSGAIVEVINTNIIRQLVKVVMRKEDGTPEILEMRLDELDLQRDNRPPKNRPNKNRDKDVKPKSEPQADNSTEPKEAALENEVKQQPADSHGKASVEKNKDSNQQGGNSRNDRRNSNRSRRPKRNADQQNQKKSDDKKTSDSEKNDGAQKKQQKNTKSNRTKSNTRNNKSNNKNANKSSNENNQGKNDKSNDTQKNNKSRNRRPRPNKNGSGNGKNTQGKQGGNKES